MAKILIVDDDFEIVGLLTEVLSREGYAVEPAYDPAEGMKKTRAIHPDLIIVDYNMPGATGAHLYESIRRDPGSAATPILFLSGDVGSERILKEIADSGNAMFLPKPVKLAEFRKAVADLLGAKNG
ncbi:MAG: response regulator [Elusimicrobiota bacterium]